MFTIRLVAQTRFALEAIATEALAETGEKHTADDALWWFIEKNRPDIIEKVETMSGKRVRNNWARSRKGAVKPE